MVSLLLTTHENVTKLNIIDGNVYSGGNVSAIEPEFVITPIIGGNVYVTVPFNTFIFAVIVLLNATLVSRVMVVSGKL